MPDQREGQSPDAGTGGTLDEAVREHADILAAEDNQDEGEAPPDTGEQDVVETDEDDIDVDDLETDTGDEDGEDDGDDSEGDEEDEDDGDEDDDAEPTFKVKVDGEEVEVSQSELLSGYTRQADYTKKTQALAEQRKAHEAEAEAVRGERQQYATLLEQLANQVNQAEGQEPDWDKLYQEDPNEWLRQRELHRTRQERKAAIEAEQARIEQQQEQERQEQLAKTVEAEKAKIAEAIPEWADEEKAKTERAEIVKYGLANGFSEEELSRVYDHRGVVLLRKAMLYDKAVAKRGSAKPKPAAKGPKTAKPGNTQSGRNSKSREAKARRERLAQSGSTRDAAELLIDLL